MHLNQSDIMAQMSEHGEMAQQGQAPGQVAVAVVGPALPRQEPADSQALDPGFRQREEINVLLMGFGAGMTIAFIFLVYVVLEAARLLT
jgi:hypothetical protein